MARPRKKANRDLPLNLYFNKDTKAYRYKDTITGKWHPFGLERLKAIKSAQILNAKLMTNTDLIAAVMADHTLTVSSFIEEYKEKVMPERNLKKSTEENYLIRLRQIENAFGRQPLNMVSLKQISDFLSAIDSIRASNQARARIIDLFNQAAARGLVESNVAEKPLNAMSAKCESVTPKKVSRPSANMHRCG
jgi:hypothetical protein